MQNGFSGGRYTVSDNSLELSKDVFQQCTLTGKYGFFLFLSGGFAQMFGQVSVSARVKTLYNTNFEVSRHIILKGKRPHFRLKCVTQKYLCLSSQISPIKTKGHAKIAGIMNKVVYYLRLLFRDVVIIMCGGWTWKSDHT